MEEIPHFQEIVAKRLYQHIAEQPVTLIHEHTEMLFLDETPGTRR